jgi:hypothetical protein
MDMTRDYIMKQIISLYASAKPPTSLIEKVLAQYERLFIFQDYFFGGRIILRLLTKSDGAGKG